MLDRLSSGVAQFDAKRQVVFANLPFQRIFALNPAMLQDSLSFDRLLDVARDAGRLPEVRDFPAWRREKADWFSGGDALEEAWPSADGTHLRIVAQPMPDGGLLLIAEDRTEQLQLSANRDTLLRTRTATFDSLYELVVSSRPMAACSCGTGVSPGTGASMPTFSTPIRISRRCSKSSRPKLARPQLAKAVGDVVRAATLDRKQTGGRAALADGRTLRFTGVPLPDGNGLLAVLDITDTQKAEDRAQGTQCGADRGRCDQDPVPRQHELRIPHAADFDRRICRAAPGRARRRAQPAGAANTSAISWPRSAGSASRSKACSTSRKARPGVLPLARENIELLPFVSGIVEERARRIEEAGLTLDLRGDKSAGRIEGDGRRLNRAIGHLLDNAIAATPRGGRILVELSPKKSGARIVVSDDGAGHGPDRARPALGGLKLSADGKTSSAARASACRSPAS